MANQRDDEFGGSVVNRGRLILEIVKTFSAAIDNEKVGIRLAPSTIFEDMGMPGELEQYIDRVEQLDDLDIAFLPLVEPPISGSKDAEPDSHPIEPLIAMWNPDRSLVLGGGFTLDRAMEAVDQRYEQRKGVVAIGRQYTSRSGPHTPVEEKENYKCV